MEGAKNMKNKILFLLSTIALVVSGCTPKEKHEEIKKDEYDLVNEFLDDTEVTFSDDADSTPLQIDPENPYTELTQSIYDFDSYKTSNADLIYTIVDKNMITEPPATPVSSILIEESDVILYDNHGENHEFKTFVGGYGIATLTIAPSIFNKKLVYYLELKNENLKFRGKEDDIRRLTFYTMERDLPAGRHVSYRDDIIDLDSTKVYYYDEDGYSPYFVYEEELSLAPDTTFRLRHPALEADDIETVYGTIISINKNPNGAGYMVRYNPANGSDIFSTLAINESRHLTDEDVVSYYDIDEEQKDSIVQSVLHSPSMVITMYGIMNAFNVTPEMLARDKMDWGSRIDIKISTSYDINTSSFTFSINAAYTFYPDKNITITLKAGWKQTWTFDVTASVSIATEFFIPVGIDYTLKVMEDTQKEIYFGICISYDHAGEYNEDVTNQSIEKAVLDAYNSRSDWQKRSVFKGDGPTATPGGAKYPIFKLSCTAFLPLEIYFDIEFYWDLIPTMEAVIKYASHTQRVDLCVSNKGGSSPSSDSATKTNSSLSFTLIGKLHFEAGFKISIGVDIIGLYNFFHFEVYLKAYGALDIQGYLFADISWDDGGAPVTPNLNIGCKFEISVGLKVGIDLYLLFGGYNHEWPLVSVPLFGVQAPLPFQEFAEESGEMYISQNDYDPDTHYFDLSLGERHLLAARTFNSQSFSVEIRDLQFDEKVKAIYGAFVPVDVYFTVFSLDSITITQGTLVDGSFLSLSADGHVMLDTIEGQDNFTAEIVIRTNKEVTVGRSITKTITVHFTNSNRQSISVDGNGLGSFVDGAVVTLPVPEPVRYKKFVGYSYENQYHETVNIEYDEDNPDSLKYTVDTTGDFRECNITSVWIDYYHWEVYFVDGFNNLIEKQMVLNGEDAVEPAAEKRDYNMTANPPDDNHHYEFVAYDRPLTNISGPTVIRAIYRIVNN